MSLDKDEVIKLAEDVCKQINPDSVSPLNPQGDYLTMTPGELLAFVNAIAEKQREKDARICEELRGANWATLADAIRANKEPESDTEQARRAV